MSSMRSHYYDHFTDFFDDVSSHIVRPNFLTAERSRDFFRPRMDMHENAENNTVTASLELPGLKPDEVNIDINQDRLTISGESSAAQQRDERAYSVRERSWGKFSRTLSIPQGTKPEDVKAKMEHGVLSVTFPKAQPMQQPTRITIEGVPQAAEKKA